MRLSTAALIVANSPLAEVYAHSLHAYLGPLSVHHWINDALMALFFLLIGLEVKRELVEGELSTWGSRILPGAAAIGGMAVPALVFLAFNGRDPSLAHGWAVPAATDIAFALGVLGHPYGVVQAVRDDVEVSVVDPALQPAAGERPLKRVRVLGQDLVRRLSRRLGEGIFHAALTARIGAAAVEVTRPLPFIEAPPIRVRDFLGELMRRAPGTTEKNAQPEKP